MIDDSDKPTGFKDATKAMKFHQITDPPRSLRRSMAKAAGEPLRSGPAKASDGSEKGPAQVPGLAAMRRLLRKQKKEDAK